MKQSDKINNIQLYTYIVGFLCLVVSFMFPLTTKGSEIFPGLFSELRKTSLSAGVENELYHLLERENDLKQTKQVLIRKDSSHIDILDWDGNIAFSVIPQFPEGNDIEDRSTFTSEASQPWFSDRIEYEQDGVTAFVEPKKGTNNEFDVDFTLRTKPNTNVFSYRIEGAEHFDFWYQPELTDAERVAGFGRPERVVGSYAVYHKTNKGYKKGETNYGTGKLLHIYRPKAIDAEGDEVWAELFYNEDTKLLRVVVPQEFLDSAAYPVIVDPTFGYTTCGTSNVTNASHFFDSEIPITIYSSIRLGNAANLSVDGTVDSIHACLSTSYGNDTISMKVYVNTEDAGADSHSEDASVEEDKALTSSGTFYSFTAASEALVADDFVLSSLADASDIDQPSTGQTNTVRLHFDSSGSRNTYSEGYSGSSGYANNKNEDPWTETETSASTQYSLYVTYTETAAAAPTFGDGRTSGFVFGKLGQAMAFDGIDDYVDIGSAGNGIQTVAFWIKIATSTASQKIIDIDGTDQVETDGSGNITATSFPSATIYVDGSSASANIPDTHWHHVVISDSTGVNGTDFDIGRIETEGYFGGTLDDVRIYSRAFTATEAKRLYELGK